MEIRPLTMADYDAARAVWDAVDHLGPVPRVEVEEKLRRDPELFLVAEDAGRIVGTVMGSYDGRRGWLARLAVVPDRQGEGIARQLVDAVESRMRELGVRRVNLLVFPDNTPGNAFWEAAGFTAADTVVLRSKALVPDVDAADPSGSC